MARIVLCRYGELFLKGGNRGRFERALRANVKRALAGVSGAKIEAPHGRIVVRCSDQVAADVSDRLVRVFGLVSLSVAEETAPEIDAIGAAAVAAAGAAPAGSFKIEARRSDKHFPLTSPEIMRVVGARVVEATRRPVDVHDPSLVVGIEVGANAAYVWAGARAAPGGLPVGSSGRGLLLLSGGIDSPVAGWLAAKRGLAIEAVYFHSPPYVGEKSKDKVVSLARILGRWQACGAVTVVGFTDVQKRLRDAGPAALCVVLYRRMMMRIADRIADRVRADALVTGENLGQVASQTVTNLQVIEAAAGRLVLRPLATYDKVETTALARRIGSYQTSALPYEDCCSLFVPAHPATSARTADVERIESKLDITAIADEAAATAERIAL